jgi:hypothetical protein
MRSFRLIRHDAGMPERPTENLELRIRFISIYGSFTQVIRSLGSGIKVLWRIHGNVHVRSGIEFGEMFMGVKANSNASRARQ